MRRSESVCPAPCADMWFMIGKDGMNVENMREYKLSDSVPGMNVKLMLTVIKHCHLDFSGVSGVDDSRVNVYMRLDRDSRSRTYAGVYVLRHCQ